MNKLIYILFFISFTSFSQIIIDKKERRKYDKIVFKYKNEYDYSVTVSNLLNPSTRIFVNDSSTTCFNFFLPKKKDIITKCDEITFLIDGNIKLNHGDVRFVELKPNKTYSIVLKVQKKMSCSFFYIIKNKNIVLKKLKVKI